MTRRTGCIVAALAAATLALALGALQSVAWHGDEAPAFARALAARADPGLLAEPASKLRSEPTESYFGYGRLAAGIYALIVATAVAVRRRWPSPLGAGLVALLAIAFAGDVVAYWASEHAGPGVRRIGFWLVEVPALAALVVASSAVGVYRLRSHPVAPALAAALPLALGCTALLAYMPHGPLAGIALTLALVAAVPQDDRRAPAHGARTRRRWGRGLALATLGVLGAAGLALAYRPVLRIGPPVAAEPLPATDRLEGARLHVFNTGYNRMSWLLVGRERPWRPVPAFVVEVPDGGLFVFDTGFPDAVARAGEAGLHAPERWVIESRSAPGLLLPAQMRAAGLDPAAVHHVVVSHLHGDHVGQLDAFPNARVLGGPGSAARADHRFVDRWHEVAFGSRRRHGPLDDVVDFTGDGSIVLARGGGHANEGLMLLLALDEGPVLLAGDEVVHGDWLRSNDVQRIVVDPDRAAAVRNAVRALAGAPSRPTLVFGHDLRDVDCTRSDVVCHANVTWAPERLDTPEIEAVVGD